MTRKQYAYKITLLFLLLNLAMFISGCGLENILQNSMGSRHNNSTPVQKQDPVVEADAALLRGDYAHAEVLGQRLMNDQNAGAKRRTEIARIYATAAAKNRHPNVALNALEVWQQESQGVDTTREWQDVWCEAMGQLSSREARTKANEVYQDTSRAPAIRGVAGIFFAVRQWGDGEIGQTMEALSAIYKATPDTPTKALFEDRLALQLHGASSQVITLAASTVTPENRNLFPHNLIAIEFLRKQSLQPATHAQAEAELAKIKSETVLANPSLFDGPPLIKVTPTYVPSTSQQQIVGARTVALALPLSGAYASVATKIAAGAELARAEMSASGTPINLLIVDTESPNWIATLSNSDATMVGGPLRSADYVKAKSAGLLSQKTFFAFLPSLEGNDEGQVAWRLFASSDDQIRALLDFSGKLGVQNYASIYPAEPYGQRMVQAFNRHAQQIGMNAVQASPYTPNVPNSWRGIIGELLASNKNPSAGGFQAVFIPDGWKSSEILISTIHQFNEPRMLLLGTSLWEQGLTQQSTIQSPQNYQLAVFPGSWNTAYPSEAGQRLLSGLQQKGMTADFWTGLGYDYARLSASMSVVPGWTPASINMSLQSLSFAWSIAPLRWDSTGHAEQDLFLFTPAEGLGFAPVDIPSFRQRFDTLWQQNL